MVSVQKAPSIADLMDTIRSAGSGSDEVFGYPLLPNGLYLQQDPKEFAEFVTFMATHAPPSGISLDIGVASGGQTKFLRDYYVCEKTITLDLGEHPDAIHWERIKASVNSDIILDIRDDSHAPHVRKQLLPYKRKIDFAFVDGDHSYEGLRQDIILVRELLRPGAFMALHDTASEPECRRVYKDLLRSHIFEHVRDFESKFGISLWRMKKTVLAAMLTGHFAFRRL
jgi:hypothetical protein